MSYGVLALALAKWNKLSPAAQDAIKATPGYKSAAMPPPGRAATASSHSVLRGTTRQKHEYKVGLSAAKFFSLGAKRRETQQADGSLPGRLNNVMGAQGRASQTTDTIGERR